jgi:hypothetical protein
VKGKSFLQGAGFATLYILPIAKRFLDQSLNETYHHPHTLSSVPLAILAMMLLLWLVSSMVFLVIGRLPEPWRNPVSIAFGFLLVALLLRFLLFMRNPVYPSVALRALGVLLALLPVVLFLSRWAWRSALVRHAAAATTLLYCIAGFGILVLIPRLAVYALRTGPSGQTSFQRDGLPAQRADSRIVWILMDELSFDQTFDHRQPGLALPNFDAFAGRSISFSNLQPSGVYTELVVPGLLLGVPVQDIKTPSQGPVSFRQVAGGTWQRFDQQNTIFAEAWRLGWNPGVAGWYIPYCRLFPDVLARCSWQFSDEIPGLSLPLSYNNSVLQNMLALMPVRTTLELIHRDKLDHASHRRDYEDVMKNAEDLLRDQRVRFVFLHLPVPHPPGVYDRARHQLSSHGDYLDNLVLADDTLGTLMKVLESAQNNQQMTIIVSSDHSWRTFWWENSGSWSKEAMRVTHGGKFDPRPVLMVHLPGATSGQVISTPTSVLAVHSILDAFLREQLHTPADLEKLVDQQRRQLIASQTKKESQWR